jgi:hypothetical protein
MDLWESRSAAEYFMVQVQAKATTYAEATVAREGSGLSKITSERGISEKSLPEFHSNETKLESTRTDNYAKLRIPTHQ